MKPTIAHKKAMRFFILPFIILFTLGACDSSSGDKQPKVFISPGLAAIDQDTGFDQTVEVKNMKDVFYVAFDLTYDPNVIQFLSAKEGGFMNQSDTDESAFEIALEDGVPGRLAVGITRFGMSGTVSGNGLLMTISFQGVAPGTTTLSFTEPRQIRDASDMEVLISTWDEGVITVR